MTLAVKWLINYTQSNTTHRQRGPTTAANEMLSYTPDTNGWGWRTPGKFLLIYIQTLPRQRRGRWGSFSFRVCDIGDPYEGGHDFTNSLSFYRKVDLGLLSVDQLETISYNNRDNKSHLCYQNPTDSRQDSECPKPERGPILTTVKVAYSSATIDWMFIFHLCVF